MEDLPNITPLHGGAEGDLNVIRVRIGTTILDSISADVSCSTINFTSNLAHRFPIFINKNVLEMELFYTKHAAGNLVIYIEESDNPRWTWKFQIRTADFDLLGSQPQQHPTRLERGKRYHIYIKDDGQQCMVIINQNKYTLVGKYEHNTHPQLPYSVVVQNYNMNEIDQISSGVECFCVTQSGNTLTASPTVQPTTSAPSTPFRFLFYNGTNSTNSTNSTNVPTATPFGFLFYNGTNSTNSTNVPTATPFGFMFYNGTNSTNSTNSTN
eukprot:348779_1